MSQPRNFLVRWSRRKREADRVALPAEPPAGSPALQARAQDISASPGVPAEQPCLTEEELAALPKLEDLTAETDITAFLRPGVPEQLRQAALRRAWALDPKIRDYVCEAREYAYDWNLPGDVPGYGPLPRGLDVKALAGRLFRARPASHEDRSPESLAPTTAASTTAVSAVGNVASAGTDPAVENATAENHAPPSNEPVGAAGTAPACIADGAGIELPPSTAAPSGSVPRRRHGGALPA